MAVQIIGRREELVRLAAFLTDLPAGGQALLLEGDAGIGKNGARRAAVRSSARVNPRFFAVIAGQLGANLGPDDDVRLVNELVRVPFARITEAIELGVTSTAHAKGGDSL